MRLSPSPTFPTCTSSSSSRPFPLPAPRTYIILDRRTYCDVSGGTAQRLHQPLLALPLSPSPPPPPFSLLLSALHRQLMAATLRSTSSPPSSLPWRLLEMEDGGTAHWTSGVGGGSRCSRWWWQPPPPSPSPPSSAALATAAAVPPLPSVDGADSLLTAIAMLMNEARESGRSAAPSSSSASPPLLLLLVSAHLRSPAFCSSQSRFRKAVDALTFTLACTVQLIDATNSTDSAASTTSNASAAPCSTADSTASAASPTSTSMWLDALSLLPNALPVLRASWDEAEVWLSVAASVEPIIDCRGVLVLEEATRESGGGRGVGAHSDWMQLQAAVVDAAAEAAALQPSTCSWSCPVLLSPACRPPPAPSHMQLCGCHRLPVERSTPLQRRCAVGHHRLGLADSLPARGLGCWYEAAPLHPWDHSAGRVPLSTPASSTTPLPRGHFQLSVIRQLRPPRSLADGLRDSHGSALRLLPDTRDQAALSMFRALMGRLRERGVVLLLHLGVSPLESTPATAAPPLRTSVFIVELDSTDDCCWVLPYRCLEQLVAAPVSCSPLRGASSTSMAVLASSLAELDPSPQPYRAALHSSNWTAAVSHILERASAIHTVVEHTAADSHHSPAAPTSAPPPLAQTQSRPGRKTGREETSQEQPARGDVRNRSVRSPSSSSFHSSYSSSCSTCSPSRERGRRGGERHRSVDRGGSERWRRRQRSPSLDSRSPSSAQRRGGEHRGRGRPTSRSRSPGRGRAKRRRPAAELVEGEWRGQKRVYMQPARRRSSSSECSAESRSPLRARSAAPPKRAAKASTAPHRRFAEMACGVGSRAEQRAQGRAKTAGKGGVRGKSRVLRGGRDEEAEDFGYVDEQWEGVHRMVEEPAGEEEEAVEEGGGRPRRRSRRISARVRVQDESVAEAERRVAELDERLAALRRKRLQQQNSASPHEQRHDSPSHKPQPQQQEDGGQLSHGDEAAAMAPAEDDDNPPMLEP